MSGDPTSSRTGEPPQPGDPRDRGQRPRAGWRDRAWVLVAGALGGVTIFQFVRLGIVAMTDPELEVSGLGLLLGFVITVVWLLIVWWVLAGAWRRTVWGCPFAHLEDAAPTRRCPRHRLIAAPGPTHDR